MISESSVERQRQQAQCWRASIWTHCLYKIRTFQKMGSTTIRLFLASLPSKLRNLVTTCLKHPCPFPYREPQQDSKNRVWMTPIQRLTCRFYREVLLQHCECWRCASTAWKWDGNHWVPTCMYPASIWTHCLYKIRKFQKLGSVRVFLASLPSKLQNLVTTCLKHPCPFP